MSNFFLTSAFSSGSLERVTFVFNIILFKEKQGPISIVTLQKPLTLNVFILFMLT